MYLDIPLKLFWRKTKGKAFDRYPQSQDKHPRDNPGCLEIGCLHPGKVHSLLARGDVIKHLASLEVTDI